MKKKKPVKVKPKTETWACILLMHSDADQLERVGATAKLEGRAGMVEENFDMARCLRKAANWLNSKT